MNTSISLFLFISLIPAALATIFIHEFGHLLMRKACRCPVEYVRIPRRPTTRKTVGHIWGVRLELGTSPKDWLKGNGVTGPRPPDAGTLQKTPRRAACLILLAGPPANFAQAAVSFTIQNTTINAAATGFLGALATMGILSGAVNLSPIGTDSDGTQFWSLVFGKLTRPARMVAWSVATAPAALAIPLLVGSLK